MALLQRQRTELQCLIDQHRVRDGFKETNPYDVVKQPQEIRYGFTQLIFICLLAYFAGRLITPWCLQS